MCKQLSSGLRNEDIEKIKNKTNRKMSSKNVQWLSFDFRKQDIEEKKIEYKKGMEGRVSNFRLI